jgi:diguanylate cyclase (GGDEF)-like protein
LANLRLRKTLRNQSIRDPLTNLFNRRYLEESMDLEFARAERSQTAIGIVMIDIDHFKCYNDTYGHDGGDALLLAFTKLLTLTIRKGDLACRYGGEEFVLMLPGADACAVKRRAEVLSQAVALLAVAHGGRSLGPVTMSAGVAVYPEHGENPHSVLAAADEALLRAKANGRNRVETAPAPQMAASAVVADLDSRRIIKSIV